METNDISYLLAKNVDLDYLVTKQDDSKFGKAVTQLRALKALQKTIRDQIDSTIPDIPRSINVAIKTLIVQRTQLILTELSSMSLVPIPEEDKEIVNRLMTT